MKYKDKILEVINDETHKYHHFLNSLIEQLEKDENPNKKYYKTSITYIWEDDFDDKFGIKYSTDEFSFRDSYIELNKITDRSEDYDNIFFYSDEKDLYKKYKKEMELILYKRIKKELEQDKKNYEIWESNFKKTFKKQLRKDKLDVINLK